MKQDPNDATTVCLVRDPCPNDADENTAQHKEDEANRVQCAHLAWDKESRQMPDCPNHTENDCREPGTESLLKMRDCETRPACFLANGIDEIGSEQCGEIQGEDQSPFIREGLD